jgi:hypothetical protein
MSLERLVIVCLISNIIILVNTAINEHSCNVIILLPYNGCSVLDQHFITGKDLFLASTKIYGIYMQVNNS